mgnify:CR=1 FL=1
MDAAFSDDELREVIRNSQWRNLASGRNIVTEGELDDSFFVLVSGEVSVWKRDTELGILRSQSRDSSSLWVRVGGED